MRHNIFYLCFFHFLDRSVLDLHNEKAFKLRSLRSPTLSLSRAHEPAFFHEWKLSCDSPTFSSLQFVSADIHTGWGRSKPCDFLFTHFPLELFSSYLSQGWGSCFWRQSNALFKPVSHITQKKFSFLSTTSVVQQTISCPHKSKATQSLSNFDHNFLLQTLEKVKCPSGRSIDVWWMAQVIVHFQVEIREGIPQWQWALLIANRREIYWSHKGKSISAAEVSCNKQ